MVNIQGLNKLANLESLDLCDNQIADIGELSSLTKLKTLRLNSNKITDISALSNLINLKTLYLNNNQIVEVLPLAECNQLTYLNLKRNATIRTENYTEEEKQQLLEERKGTIALDINKLSLFKGYTSLDLSYQNLTDLSLLEGQTDLTKLYLGNNNITLEDEKSQNILKEMKKLTILDLKNNNITNISAINNLSNLTDLNLDNNRITNISAINSLSNLTSLYLSGDNNNVDLTEIEDIISNLNTFSINETSFQTIVNCTPSKIKKINLYGYKGKLPNNLSKLTSLSTLNFSWGNGTSNLDVLSNVTSLTNINFGKMDLHEKMIKDFSKLNNLTYLNLNGCSLWTSDLEGLIGLKNNENLEIDLRSNALLDPEILLELPSKFKILLGGNVNISEEFKTRLREHFGKNVSF